MDGCEGVFLSVDIDVVDPGMAPGTGTPEPGGFTARELLDAVRRCAMELPVAGFDVVEVSPPYDHAEVTAYLANRVVLEALSGITWRRRKTTADESAGAAAHRPVGDGAGTNGPLGRAVLRQPDAPLLEGRGNPAVPTPLGPTPLGPAPLGPTPIGPAPLGP